MTCKKSGRYERFFLPCSYNKQMAFVDFHCKSSSGATSSCGKAILDEDEGKTRIQLDLTVPGLPAGPHGFHVHTSGSMINGCTSMKDHYGSESDLHPNHLGDLGNVFSDSDGRIRTNLTLDVPLSDIVGRGLVLHYDEDDRGMGGTEESLHSGSAGERIACGAIVL